MLQTATVFGIVPDLHLGYPSQVNAAVGLGHGLVIDVELEIRIILLSTQVETFPIVDQDAVLNSPVLLDVLDTGFLLGRQRIG